MARSLDHRHPGAIVGRERWIVESCGRVGTCSPAQAGVALIPSLAGRRFLMTNDTRLIRILSVDDHPLLRSGIAALVDTQPDMRMVGEASNGNEAVQLHRQLNPDVTLMDLQMPGMSGLDAIISIRTEQPSARIIVLTTYGGDVLAQRALRAGAQAYVLKSPGSYRDTEYHSRCVRRRKAGPARRRRRDREAHGACSVDCSGNRGPQTGCLRMCQ